MKKILLGLFGSFTFFNILFCSPIYACTDFRLTAKDNTVLVTRSLEFALDLQSNLRSSRRGRDVQNTTANGKPVLSWKTKYGYVYLDGMNVDAAVDGLNEQGLSFEYLYLPGETVYPAIPVGKENQAIPYLKFGDWILGNFKTVDEVKQALKNISVFAEPLPALQNTIFPLHAAIYDASGKSIVVEFAQGKMQVYDNKIGLMTNSPTYDWHLTNLRNFLNLSPTNPTPIKVDGITFVATGQGAGMKGLPGDVSPPSRFVKIAAMLKTVIPANNKADIVNLAEHIINNVDIPLGFVREAQDENKYTSDITQWVVFKDLTHKVFYYRTYNDLTLRAVDLTKVDFSPNGPLAKMPISASPVIQDVTTQFVASK